MADIELTAEERAFPSRGRARIHNDTLTSLGIAEGAAIEVSPAGGGNTVTVTAFADSLVDRKAIRLAKEDLAAIGSSAGSTLKVRKKPPVGEQIRTGIEGAKTAAASGIGSLKGATPESVAKGAKETAKGFQADVGKTAGELGAQADAAIKAGMEKAKVIQADLGKKAGAAAHEAKAAFAKAVEDARKRLKPADAVLLDKALRANKGEVRAVTVPAGIGTRTLDKVVLPKGVVLAAVQRGNAIQTTDPSFILISGDIVYLVGESGLLDEASKVIGG
jgi:hypothetical protein